MDGKRTHKYFDAECRANVTRQTSKGRENFQNTPYLFFSFASCAFFPKSFFYPIRLLFRLPFFVAHPLRYRSMRFGGVYFIISAISSTSNITELRFRILQVFFFLAAYNSQILALGGRRYCTSATLSSVDLSIGANIYVCVLDFWRGARETGRSEAFRRAFRWIRVSRNVPRPAFVTNFKHAYKFIYDFHLVHSFSFGFGLLQYIFRLFRCLFAVLLFSLLWPHYYFLRFANIPLFAPALVQIRMPDKYFLTQNFHAKHIRHAMRDIFSFYRKRIAPFHHKRPRSISLHMNRIKIFKSGVNMPNWCGTI